MASGSERISKRWVEGAERACIKCWAEITNLDRQVGEVRTRYVDGKPVREIICMDCSRPNVGTQKVRKEE